MKVVFYTIGCPQCLLMERKLKEKHIQYEEKNDIEEMISLGFEHAPILVVDGKSMGVKESLNWIKSI